MILAKKLREKRWSGTRRSEDKAGKINHTQLYIKNRKEKNFIENVSYCVL